ncbi:heme peroxidase [Amylostereum chailletii]|nr:heme peroxidase [Amylostereum chailletii]
MAPNGTLLDIFQGSTEYVTDISAPVDTNGAARVPSLLEKSAADLVYTVQHGSPVSVSDLPAFIDAAKNLKGRGLDDRKFLLEKLLTLMARLPPGSEFSARLQQVVMNTLYSDLPHPPAAYLADLDLTPRPQDHLTKGVKYAFRSADGSHYNQLIPSMGQARAPYARTVPPRTDLNSSTLPAPGVVFDSLLKRDEFVEHPGGISSMFFAFAALVIHSIFHTDHHDWTQNNTSSYLDLSPLYGDSQEQQDRLRRKDGSGKLWEDVFADSRLLYMPPAACSLLVLLSRNHNYIADKLLSINEQGTYSSPPPTDDVKRLQQDDELFHRARLVNTGFFMQIILGDYVAAILGLVRDGLTWRLDPTMNMRETDHEVVPRGEGNVCSVEFNLLYRWHATLSQADEAWTENEFQRIFDGKDPTTVTPTDFITAAHKYMNPGPNEREWTFDGLKRGPDGRFADADLARILLNATEAPASAYKARGIPEALRVIEILSIEQARSWGTCSMNEFRQFIGLKPYADFKEWNPDPKVYEAAEALYHNIENLELYVGLQAEEAKKPMPGAGLCPGYTISRSILADAVSLVRGDRFLTTDYTPTNLSHWGYQDCQVVPTDGSYGGMLTKLLYRHLPDYYPAGSAYAHFPFLVPKTMKGYLVKQGDDVVKSYTWTRPVLPAALVATIETFAGVERVLREPVFESTVMSRLDVLTRDVGIESKLANAVLCTPLELEKATERLVNITRDLIKQSTTSTGGTTAFVDIVHDVLNVLPVHWISNFVTGTSIKSETNPAGIHRAHDQYDMYAAASNYVYHNNTPDNDWVLREAGQDVADQVTTHLRHLIDTALGSLTNTVRKAMNWLVATNDESDEYVEALVKQLEGDDGERMRAKLAASVFAEFIPTAPLFSQALAHAINFYLDESRAADKAAIVAFGDSGTPSGYLHILPYIYEALRLDPPLSSVSRTTNAATTIDGISLVAGQPVLASIVKANLDPKVFSDPRPPLYNRSTPGVFGFDERGLLTPRLFELVAPRVVYEILRLQGVRKSASRQLKPYTELVNGIPEQMYLNEKCKPTPFPRVFEVQFNVAGAAQV